MYEKLAFGCPKTVPSGHCKNFQESFLGLKFIGDIANGICINFAGI